MSDSLEDVVFGEQAMNYEEGKWTVNNGRTEFMPDVRICKVEGASMAAFIKDANQPIYKCGDFISGCAVRMDAGHIFDRIKSTVRLAYSR